MWMQSNPVVRFFTMGCAIFIAFVIGLLCSLMYFTWNAFWIHLLVIFPFTLAVFGCCMLHEYLYGKE